jgi:uncharacterized protein
VRVVLDTNVLISGIFFSGPPNLILKSWRNGDIQFVLSSEIIDEYVKVSGILAEEHPKIDISSILTLIASHSETIQSIPLPHQVCEDPDDDKFLACAISGRCEFIISGDRHLIKVSGYRGIMVITPREFIDRYVK